MKATHNNNTPFAKALVYVLLTALFVNLSSARANVTSSNPDKPLPEKDRSIMLALLLDTSNSMDGLIDQAKSQLWKIVNELAIAKCTDGTKPNIKIALYEYGNDRLSAAEGYIRLVSPLTSDLDVISQKLFSLSTNGGEEYCGRVIKKSLTQLDWSASTSDLKMIFIAGNEPFNQGEIPYTVACALAKEKDVVVNTIFCGDFNEGSATRWKNGADITGGTYMSIEQDRKTVYIATPYDEKISALNDRLNDTYIYYGKAGESKKALQIEQDKNAESYSRSNKVERAVSKSSHAYQNAEWDLVDAAKDDEKAISKAQKETLPKEMQALSTEQQKSYVKVKGEERKKLQSEIQVLNKKRAEFIASQHTGNTKENSLDAAMIKAIKERAKAKNLDF